MEEEKRSILTLPITGTFMLLVKFRMGGREGALVGPSLQLSIVNCWCEWCLNPILQKCTGCLAKCLGNDFARSLLLLIPFLSG